MDSIESDILKSMAVERIKIRGDSMNWFADNKTKKEKPLFLIDAKFDTVSQKFTSWVSNLLKPCWPFKSDCKVHFLHRLPALKWSKNRNPDSA